MTLWIDADACPVVVKELICRTSIRTQIPAIFVANHSITLPKSAFIRLILVANSFDAADRHILAHIQSNDLLITADLLLAASAIERGAHVLTPHGKHHHSDNIHTLIATRTLLDSLRASNPHDPPAYSKQKPYTNKDKHQFANQLDSLLRQLNP